ncbi:hypothetical protein EHQ52_06935 [Leptospira koniambonensis]|uniref:(2Fe-2S) ferredoxin domain-containing protein n=1 Tax=Leptospira koniambonensis TaxID=2484950 RepID=A0A4R9J8X3_9LEPT|nr:hypothetical protein [Leptospira koniambonensis]TGL34251.1 hypothetical protein EHQ52_06935 [Leptospira koniambonensis]
MNIISLFQGREEVPIQNVEYVSADWEEAILVCNKCAMKIKGETDGRRTRIKSELKEALNSEGIKNIRVLEVSCLDVCKRNRIAITFSKNPQMSRKILLVPPKISGKEILPKILPDRFRS